MRAQVGLVVFGSVPCQASPAAADVQDSVTSLEAQFPADEVQLGFLCVIQIPGLIPICAAIDHSPVEHIFKEFISPVIVSFPYSEMPLIFCPD